jgi:hypothetical protein
VNNLLSSCRRLDKQHLPASNVQFIIDALADYAKEIGKDVFKNPFATMLERSNSLEAILRLLPGREKVVDESQIVIAIFFFKEYREVVIGDRSTASAQQ